MWTRATFWEQRGNKHAGQSKIHRPISDDVSATLPMTPVQWKTEVLITITFWLWHLPGAAGWCSARQAVILCAGRTNTPTHTCVAAQWQRLGTCRSSRMRHWSHNKCQVRQWTPCGRHVFDGVNIGPIMHRSRAVNALWSTCSRRRSHRSDNAEKSLKCSLDGTWVKTVISTLSNWVG